MERIDSIEEYQSYYDYVLWREKYDKNYGRLEEKQPEISERLQKIIDSKYILNTSLITYKIFEYALTKRLKQIRKDYIIDDNNTNLIRKISKYTTIEDDYEDRGMKGFIIMGGTGTGKTLICEAYYDVLSKFFNVRIPIIPSYAVVDKFIKESYECFNIKSRTMRLIDDLGSENLHNNYGITTNVVLEYIYRLYDRKSRTFATTNLDPSSLKKFYGERGYSRMVEMFYFFNLNGKDRRL